MKPVAWKEVVEPVTFRVRDLEVRYKESKAICMDCNNEVYMSSINDKNVDRRLNAYLRALRGV
jgi:hypothetical protein